MFMHESSNVGIDPAAIPPRPRPIDKLLRVVGVSLTADTLIGGRE